MAASPPGSLPLPHGTKERPSILQPPGREGIVHPPGSGGILQPPGREDIIHPPGSEGILSAVHQPLAKYCQLLGLHGRRWRKCRNIWI